MRNGDEPAVASPLLRQLLLRGNKLLLLLLLSFEALCCRPLQLRPQLPSLLLRLCQGCLQHGHVLLAHHAKGGVASSRCRAAVQAALASSCPSTPHAVCLCLFASKAEFQAARSALRSSGTVKPAGLSVVAAMEFSAIVAF